MGPLCPLCPWDIKYKHRDLTLLILDCWQRQYDKRPYQNFRLDGKIFREKMHRPLDDNDLFTVAEFLRKRKIKRFELKNIDEPIGASALTAVALNLQNANKITLKLIDVPIGMMQGLVDIAKRCNTKYLSLTGNSFTRDHAECMRDFLLKSPSLEYLDVSYCDIDHIKLAIIADGILHSPKLKSINLSRIVNIHEYACVDATKIAIIIAMLAGQVVTLHEIKCKLCHLRDDDMIPICEYLEVPHSKIQFMDFNSNHIGADGIKTLLEAAIHSPALIGLNVGNNKLGEHGGEIIAHMLPFTHLKYLSIEHNKIPAKIMELILLTIRKPHSMRILNIYGNEFDYSVGEILRRKFSSGVLLTNCMDVYVAYDKDVDKFRVVPQPRIEFDYKYFLKFGNDWTLNVKSLFHFEKFDETIVGYMNQMCDTDE